MSIRITDLPQAEALDGSELLAVVQNGITKKSSANFLAQENAVRELVIQGQQVLAQTVIVRDETGVIRDATGVIRDDTQDINDATDQVFLNTQAVFLDFQRDYLGAKALAPTVDNEGNPLQVGAIYWNTALEAMFVWDGLAWQAFSSAVASVNGRTGEVIGLGEISGDLTQFAVTSAGDLVLIGIEPTGTADSAVAAHVALADPHTQYTTTAAAAAAAPVQSVAGRTGAVVLAVADVTNAVPDARTLTAGEGLTGGGTLAADRTVDLGVPSTLTTVTTNATTATSHTHAVTFPVTSVASKTGAVTLAVADVANAVPDSRTISAGSGLTGGGDLVANRSITLGTPSTLTTATLNAITATSHTHEVTFPVTSVASKTGAVTLTNADVGLSNVTNVAQVNKAGDTMTGALTAPKFIPNGTSVAGNGMYLPAANTLGFSTDGVERMRVDAAGLFTFTGTIDCGTL